MKHPIFAESRHIACYQACGSEFGTAPIIRAIWQAQKICYLPVLADAKSLNFAQYNEGDDLQPNQYSILEPVSSRLIIHPEKLDLVLMPLVAFDDAGNRIGTGGGYYDRTFAFIFSKPVKTPLLMGLGFSVQACTNILAEPWDIKLQAVLTEKKLIVF